MQLEKKKELELKARIEKDQIRRELVDLEKNKLGILDQEKRRELEKLVNEREMLKFKEKELIADIENLEENTNLLNKMRQEEIDRLGNVILIKIYKKRN